MGQLDLENSTLQSIELNTLETTECVRLSVVSLHPFVRPSIQTPNNDASIASSGLFLF